MPRCLIFCAGEFDGFLFPILEEDLILAADGGYRYVNQCGLKPHFILGDFDSLGYKPEGAQIYPVEKDDTDTGLAIKLGLEKGCREFILYAGLEGSRLDHTVANYQSLFYLAQQGAQGFLVGASSVVTLIHNSSLFFPGQPKGDLSVFAIGGRAEGVSISGAKYTLQNSSLSDDFPLGVSNCFCEQPCRISVEKGSLLVFYDRENGLIRCGRG